MVWSTSVEGKISSLTTAVFKGGLKCKHCMTAAGSRKSFGDRIDPGGVSQDSSPAKSMEEAPQSRCCDRTVYNWTSVFFLTFFSAVSWEGWCKQGQRQPVGLALHHAPNQGELAVPIQNRRGHLPASPVGKPNTQKLAPIPMVTAPALPAVLEPPAFQMQDNTSTASLKTWSSAHWVCFMVI